MYLLFSDGPKRRVWTAALTEPLLWGQAFSAMSAVMHHGFTASFDILAVMGFVKTASIEVMLHDNSQAFYSSEP